MQQELTWTPGQRQAVARAPAGEALRGAVIFASAEEQAQLSTELLGAGALLITLPPPTRDTRGRLGEILEELVERELARVGAPSAYLAAWGATPEDAQARLADQLLRIQATGASGLAIAMGSLRSIGMPVLALEDSATLRWLADTTLEAALVLLVDDADLGLTGHAAPVALGELLARHPAHSALRDPGRGARCVESAPSLPIMLAGDDATATDTRVEIVAPIETPSIEIAEAILAAEPIAAEPIVAEPIAAEPIVAEPIVAEPIVAEPPPPPRPSPRRARDARPRMREALTAGIPISGPSDAWRTWAIALAGAKGAQPLATFERLFAESYVPLANAIAAGLDDARALRAYDEFRRSFERSYTDAFATFGATNRRPRLVMDAYDLAAKQARLSNARAAHVLVVDSMRYDLGCMVRDRVSREAAGIATQTAELLLWSALPTTTMRQLETFARGLDALRAPAHEEPSESLRGRAAEVVRRLRVGSRELYKLDLVPSMLDGGAADPRDVVASFESIADAAAESIARHISTLSPRTLLFLIGDHGFSIDRRGAIHGGGASPEEVLVPAFAWLLGDLH